MAPTWLCLSGSGEGVGVLLPEELSPEELPLEEPPLALLLGGFV
jgi:hypothetical protein